VPFVGSLLVRDRWYGERLAHAHRRDNPEHWFKGLEDVVFSGANMNLNRIAGRNRFMGRLLVSDWVVSETTHDLCTADLGYAHLVDQVEHEGSLQERVGVAVPTSKRSLLVVRPPSRPSVRSIRPYLRSVQLTRCNSSRSTGPTVREPRN